MDTPENNLTLPLDEENNLQDTPQPAVDYTEENIRHLDDMEHIRVRSGMYIGRLGDGSQSDDGIYVLLKETNLVRLWNDFGRNLVWRRRKRRRKVKWFYMLRFARQELDVWMLMSRVRFPSQMPGGVCAARS